MLALVLRVPLGMALTTGIKSSISMSLGALFVIIWLVISEPLFAVCSVVNVQQTFVPVREFIWKQVNGGANFHRS